MTYEMLKKELESAELPVEKWVELATICCHHIPLTDQVNIYGVGFIDSLDCGEFL